MKIKSFIIVLLVLLSMIVCFTPVFAQGVDVSNMDNAQLTTLLMQILQRLETTEEPIEITQPTATPTPMPELSDDTVELEALLKAVMQKLAENESASTPKTYEGTMVPVSDAKKEPENSIWENKKLIIEGLPSYMFIQPTVVSDNNNNGGGGNPTPDPGSRTCDGRPGVCRDGTLAQCVCDIYGNCWWTCAKG